MIDQLLFALAHAGLEGCELVPLPDGRVSVLAPCAGPGDVHAAGHAVVGAVVGVAAPDAPLDTVVRGDGRHLVSVLLRPLAVPAPPA